MEGSEPSAKAVENTYGDYKKYDRIDALDKAIRWAAALSDTTVSVDGIIQAAIYFDNYVETGENIPTDQTVV